MSDNVIELPWPSGHPIPDRDDRDWVHAPELVAEAGITYRQLDYWSRTGLLVPLEQVPGSGYLRRFSDHQLKRAAVVKQLLDAGMSLPRIRQVVDDVVQHGRVEIGLVTITLHEPSEAS